MTQTFDDTEYGRLLAELKVVPRPITSEAEHKAFLEIASGLMKKEPLSAEETTLLSHLAILISSYERERYAGLSSEKSTPSELLAYLLEENQLTQSDFAPAIPQSRLSDILAGKRKISVPQAWIFGERFKVNPSLFLYGAPSTAKGGTTGARKELVR